MTFKLTDLGKLLEAQLAAGSKPIITRIEGSDAYSSNPEALLAVQDVKQTLQVEAVTVVDGKSHLKFILSNIGLNEEYYLKQIGIYAKQTEDSEEILYFIGQDRNGERIPAISEKEVEFEYDLTITVDNAYEVTVAVSGNDFARKEMLDKKIDGNGGDISETVIAATEESQAEYPVPAAGDSAKTVLGKVQKFFADIRNWMTGVCLLGQIVNNCVTDNAKLPLSAAMGKQLQDAITVLNTNQQNTENKVPDIRYGEFNTTAKTKIPITKSTGILILAHRGVAEQTSSGAVYIITAGGARNIAALNPSGNFKVKNGDGYAYVTSSETYWAYVYVTR